MKKGLIVALVALLAFSGSAMAQKNIKLGHINSNELMQIMPGRDSAQAALQKEVEALQAELETMNKEFETKYNDYVAKRDQLSELIRKTKESDLQSMRARIEESRSFLKSARKPFLNPLSTVLRKPSRKWAKRTAILTFSIQASALCSIRRTATISCLSSRKNSASNKPL